MDQSPKRIEDLPVEPQQAAEVKGGHDISIKGVIDPNVKSFVDPNFKSLVDPND